MIIQIDGFSDVNSFLHNNSYEIRNELFFEPTLYQTFQGTKFTRSALFNLLVYYVIENRGNNLIILVYTFNYL
ncbi:MAG: hypothetical protein ACI8ZX_002140 [Planctomycetota bacterium]|jgi:hypothetical protein